MKFAENSCAGICAADLPSTSDFRNVSFLGNKLLGDGGTASALLNAPAGSSLEADGLRAWQNNGTVLNAVNCSLTLSSLSFTDNFGVAATADNTRHAVIALVNSTAVVDESQFKRNVGGIGSTFFLQQSTLSVANSTFTGNRAVRGGVLMASSKSVVTFVNCSFLANRSSHGAVVFSSESKIHCDKSVFGDNKALRNGGCFYATKGSAMHISNSSFRGGTAKNSGGLLFAKNHSEVFLQSVVLEKGVARCGGAAALYESSLVAERTSFSECKAVEGGALSSNASSTVCQECLFENNVAKKGGAVSFEPVETESPSHQFDKTTFRNNTADYGGIDK